MASSHRLLEDGGAAGRTDIAGGNRCGLLVVDTGCFAVSSGSVPVLSESSSLVGTVSSPPFPAPNSHSGVVHGLNLLVPPAKR